MTYDFTEIVGDLQFPDAIMRTSRPYCQEFNMRFMIPILTVVLRLPAVCSQAAEQNTPFGDVPKDHWAAPSVNALAETGVLKGYPDKSFKGDRYVTRYELAAALSGLAEYFQRSREPLVKESSAAPAADSKLRERDPAKWLIENGYLPKNTDLARKTNTPVKASEMADAMAAVLARMCELDVKANPPKPLPNEKEWETR